MGLHEQLGREADRAASLHTEYRKLLAVAAQVSAGLIAPGRVVVDMLAESWQVMPEPPKDMPKG